MPASTIVEDDVNFVHWEDCATKRRVSEREYAPCHVDNQVADLCSISSVDTFTQISQCLYRLFISREENCNMRCDLHVHSIASGMFNSPGLNRICRECYTEPAEVYERLKRMGMSIVTLTDHDSIDGAEPLRQHADFFLSEEVTVRMPSGTEMHMGVYGITERDHAEIQRRRKDYIALLMYITERTLFFNAKQVFSRFTCRLDAVVFTNVRSLIWDKPWTLAMSPLAVLVPAFTAGHWLNEIRFCRQWSSAIERGEKRKRMLWDLDSNFEGNWAN